jgi:hypothetical protein
MFVVYALSVAVAVAVAGGGGGEVGASVGGNVLCVGDVAVAAVGVSS